MKKFNRETIDFIAVMLFIAGGEIILDSFLGIKTIKYKVFFMVFVLVVHKYIIKKYFNDVTH